MLPVQRTLPIFLYKMFLVGKNKRRHLVSQAFKSGGTIWDMNYHGAKWMRYS